MRFLSGFSGIEGASAAWGPLGWEAAAFMEVDPFCCALLEYRYPGMPNLGDIRRVDEAAIRAVGHFDVFVFGWPCQDLSVAGKRAGLDGNRSGLFYEATRVLRLAAEHAGCRWFVAENVPGLLSSHHGRDLATVIREITGLDFPVPEEGWRNGGVAANADPGGWSLAWGTLDAQHFGVPQRRRRVFLVGHLGDWTRPVQVLFEPESLCRDRPAGRAAESRVAPSVTPGARRASGNRSGELLTLASTGPIAGGQTARYGRGTDSDATDTLIVHTLQADGFDASEDGTGRGTPLVPVAYQCHGSNVGPMGTVRSGNGNTAGGVPFIVNAAESCARQNHARPSEVARCIDSTGSFANAQGGTLVGTLACNTGPNGHDAGNFTSNQGVDAGYVMPTLSGVRRLTPRECERLQGFPDDFTLVPYRGKPAADGPRYKALGNSFAVPVVAWIGRRIEQVRSLEATRCATDHRR